MSDISEISNMERSHIFTWQDPMIGAKAARTMSGLEYLRAMANGGVPAAPIGALMNMQVAEVEEGRIVFTAVPEEYLYNPIGTIHGGFAATLLDSALGCAVHTMLPAGTAYTTLEIKVNYIRALTRETGKVFCEGKVIHMGGRVATAEARLTDESGKLYAHGTTTCIIMRPERS